MSRSPELTQVTALSCSNGLSTQVTLSFLWFLQIKRIVFFYQISHHLRVLDLN